MDVCTLLVHRQRKHLCEFVGTCDAQADRNTTINYTIQTLVCIVFSIQRDDEVKLLNYKYS